MMVNSSIRIMGFYRRKSEPDWLWIGTKARLPAIALACGTFVTFDVFWSLADCVLTEQLDLTHLIISSLSNLTDRPR